MAGPFPGMDPYIELEAPWPDFHNRLIAEICNVLGTSLPNSYIARVDERIDIAAPGMEPPRSFRPEDATYECSTGSIAPIYVEICERKLEEIRQTWIEIRALPDLELVTAIEILSPFNKSWQGRQTYLQTRRQRHESRINLVEIDLLLNGPPAPMKQRIAPGAYYAVVARGKKLPIAEIYRWSVRDPLPRLPIPLRDPDPDILIDFAALITRVYDLGRYSRTLRHAAAFPEGTAVAPDDRAWVEFIGMNKI